MAFSASLYGKFFFTILGGATGAESRSCDVLSNSLKLMLCTSAYVPNKDTHQFKSDVTNEASGTGYSAGGMALTTRVLTYDTGTDTVSFDADDVVWPNTAITARIAVLYDDTPALSTDKPLIGYIDFGADRQSFLPGSFTVAFPAGGIFTLQAA